MRLVSPSGNSPSTTIQKARPHREGRAFPVVPPSLAQCAHSAGQSTLAPLTWSNPGEAYLRCLFVTIDGLRTTLALSACGSGVIFSAPSEPVSPHPASLHLAARLLFPSQPLF